MLKSWPCVTFCLDGGIDKLKVSRSVHLVRSTKTRLSLSHHARSTLRDQAANTNLDHDAPAMQHLVHVRLTVRVSNHIDTPRLFQYPSKTGTSIYLHFYDSTNISNPQRMSSCTSTTRPTSVTRNERLAALLRLDQHQLPATNVSLHFYDSTNISYPQRTSSCTSTTRPTSATRNKRLAAFLRLDQHQLPATNV